VFADQLHHDVTNSRQPSQRKESSMKVYRLSFQPDRAAPQLKRLRFEGARVAAGAACSFRAVILSAAT
jgi:hypothetical protein